MAEQPKASGSDHRKSHRLEVSLPLLVRGRDVMGAAFEEATASYNVSREGASFTTRRELEMGQQLELSIPRRPGGPQTVASNFETTGQVRRIIPKETGEYEVGVEFTGPRLRTFMSEST